ncbi:MAG: hypothetical protein WCD57_14825 [Acidobacteriaceae bacterium]
MPPQLRQPDFRTARSLVEMALPHGVRVVRMIPFGMPYSSLGYLPKWTAAFMTVACLSWASAQQAPIEAELSRTLAGDKLTIGSSFVLRVLAPWQQAECRLAPGALLHATVQAVTRTNRHTQGITFTVEAPCGERKPLDPVLTSLLAAPRIEEETEEFPGFAPLQERISPRVTSASLNPLEASKPANFAIRHTTEKADELPATVTLGEVWHLSHIKLVLPSGDRYYSWNRVQLSTLSAMKRYS